VSPERALEPGPWRKTPAWRAGAFLVGLAILLLLLDWLSGGFVDIGFGRFVVSALLLGLALSGPYGWAASHGRAPESPREDAWIPQAHVEGERGATYVIVSPPAESRRRGLSRSPRPKELTPGWWALYNIFWRWPVMTGDYLLSGLWSLLARVWGFNGGPRLRDPAQVDRPEGISPPDEERF
jgi:hypothetical protein